jgi:DNA-binding Xre family transcriptional regulator
LASVEKLCRALDATPGDLLELVDDPPKPKRRKAASKRAR